MEDFYENCKKVQKSLEYFSLARDMRGGVYFNACSDDDDDGGDSGNGNIKMNGTSYSTIQAALSAAENASGDCTITLAAGKYEENGLTYKGSNNLKISGQGTETYGKDVIIYGQGSDMKTEKGRPTFEVTGSGNIILENLTIQNSYGTTTEHFEPFV